LFATALVEAVAAGLLSATSESLTSACASSQRGCVSCQRAQAHQLDVMVLMPASLRTAGDRCGDLKMQRVRVAVGDSLADRIGIVTRGGQVEA